MAAWQHGSFAVITVASPHDGPGFSPWVRLGLVLCGVCTVSLCLCGYACLDCFQAQATLEKEICDLNGVSLLK